MHDMKAPIPSLSHLSASPKGAVPWTASISNYPTQELGFVHNSVFDSTCIKLAADVIPSGFHKSSKSN
jgi:hypothetical protein